MRSIAWSKLASLAVPGDVQIRDLGVVTITQKNIDDAKEVGGDPEFELKKDTSMGAKMGNYLLELMR